MNKKINKLLNLDLVLHIGLHKTSTTFIQNKLERFYDELMDEGVLYPRTGSPPKKDYTSRDGAQSGQAEFTRIKMPKGILTELAHEVKPNTKTVFLSSENFTLWKRDLSPQKYQQRFSCFNSVRVILILRRQDKWIYSYYKQIVDGFIDYETRSYKEFLIEEGPNLINFQQRFQPWIDTFGISNVEVISYDDLGPGDGVLGEICKSLNLPSRLINKILSSPAPRYESITYSDTFLLRILNLANLENQDERAKLSRNLQGKLNKVELFPSTEIADTIKQVTQESNRYIEREWMRQRAPAFCYEEDILTRDYQDNEIIEAIDLAISLSSQAKK